MMNLTRNKRRAQVAGLAGIALFVFSLLGASSVQAQTVLAGWDTSTLPGGVANFGPSPFTATTTGANVTVGGLTRGSGAIVTATGSGAARGWGATDWLGTDESTAITNGDFVTFTVTANSGFTLSLSSISEFDYRRSAQGAATGTIQYQIGAGSFVDIATVNYTATASAGASLGAIDLTGISALQNVAEGTAVTFRIVNYGGTNTSGTWYIFDVKKSNALDFAVTGTLISASATPNYFAPNGTGTVGGSGIWDAASSNWNSSADGTGTQKVFESAQKANFGGSSPGTVTVDAGGVSTIGMQFDTSGYTVTGGPITLTGDGIVTVVSGGTATVASKISGSVGLTKSGLGTLLLSSTTSDFTGAVTINTGTISISSDSNLGASTAIILSGGTLQSTADLTLAATRSLSGSGSLAPASGTTLTVNGAVNAGTITIVDSGTVALAATTGAKTITGLAFSTASTVAVSGANLTLTGNVTTTQTSGTATISGPVTLGATTSVFTVADGTSNIDLLVSANLSGESVISKLGAGTLSLTGDNSGLGGSGAIAASLRIGSTSAAGGVVAFDNANALGTGQIQFNGGTLRNESGTLLTITNSNGLSIGSVDSAFNPGGAIFAGSDMLFTGDVSLFKSGSTPVQNLISFNNNTEFSGTFKESTGTGVSTGLTLGGSGSLTLSGNNTFAENVILRDTLTVNANTNTALGTGTVAIQTGATLKVASGVALSNSINLAGGTLNQGIANGGSYAATYTSAVSGGHATIAQVLAGTAGADTNVLSTFSATPSSTAANDSARVSDVLSFTGTGTDIFTLQLSYDEAAALLTGSESGLLLGYLTGGSWVNAVTANTGNDASGLQLGYTGTFASFQSTYGSDLSAYIGAYGIDIAGNTAWAVLDHNSDFSVFQAVPVPEPSSYTLIGLGLGVLWLLSRRGKLA